MMITSSTTALMYQVARGDTSLAMAEGMIALRQVHPSTPAEIADMDARILSQHLPHIADARAVAACPHPPPLPEVVSPWPVADLLAGQGGRPEPQDHTFKVRVKPLTAKKESSALYSVVGVDGVRRYIDAKVFESLYEPAD